jgi:hypothetical protein
MWALRWWKAQQVKYYHRQLVPERMQIMLEVVTYVVFIVVWDKNTAA